MNTLSATIINVYYQNKSLGDVRKLLRTLGSPVIVATESQKLGRVHRKTARKKNRYRRHSAPKYMPDHVREVSVYTKRAFEIHSVLWRIATESVGVGSHSRTIVEVRGKYNGALWSVIGVHTNSARRGKGAQENVKLWRQVRRLVRQAEKDGYNVLVMGDFNRRPDEKGKSTQHWLARVTGGTVKQERLDGAVVPSNVRVSLWRTHATPGGDHPTIRAVFTLIRRKS